MFNEIDDKEKALIKNSDNSEILNNMDLDSKPLRTSNSKYL